MSSSGRDEYTEVELLTKAEHGINIIFSNREKIWKEGTALENIYSLNKELYFNTLQEYFSKDPTMKVYLYPSGLSLDWAKKELQKKIMEDELKELINLDSVANDYFGTNIVGIMKFILDPPNDENTTINKLRYQLEQYSKTCNFPHYTKAEEFYKKYNQQSQHKTFIEFGEILDSFINEISSLPDTTIVSSLSNQYKSKLLEICEAYKEKIEDFNTIEPKLLIAELRKNIQKLQKLNKITYAVKALPIVKVVKISEDGSITLKDKGSTNQRTVDHSDLTDLMVKYPYASRAEKSSSRLTSLFRLTSSGSTSSFGSTRRVSSIEDPLLSKKGGSVCRKTRRKSRRRKTHSKSRK